VSLDQRFSTGFASEPLITVESSRGQFHQPAYVQLLLSQIPKAKKDSQVISRKKVDQLVALLYISKFTLYAVHSSLMKLTPGVLPISELDVDQFTMKL